MGNPARRLPAWKEPLPKARSGPFKRERTLFGQGGEVARELDRLNNTVDQEVDRRLLPGYVRRFVDKAAPLLDLRIDGDLESTFRLVPIQPRALDPLLASLEAYAQGNQERLTVYRPDRTTDGIWMHPGEAVFDSLSASVVGRFGNEGLNGTVFVDPYATQPYLFHMALVSVEQTQGSQAAPEVASLAEASESALPKVGLVESRLVGLRQTGDGPVEEAPVEHLLLLKGAGNFAPGSEPLALAARTLVQEAKEFAEDIVTGGMVQVHRKQIIDDLDDRMGFVARGFDYQAGQRRACPCQGTATQLGGCPRKTA